MSLGALMMMVHLEKNETKTIGLVTAALPIACIVVVMGITVLYDFGLKQRCCGKKQETPTLTQVQPINANNETMLDVVPPQTSTQQKVQDRLLLNWDAEKQHQPQEATTATSILEAFSADEIVSNFEAGQRHLEEKNKRRKQKSVRNTQLRVEARLKIRKTKTLSKTAIFAQLTPEQIDHVLIKMTFTKYFRGDVICQQGDAAKIFYIIVNGECDVTHRGNESGAEDQKVNTLHALDHFGESSLVGADQTRNATVTVSTERLQVLHLDRTTFDVLVKSGVIGQAAIEHAKVEALERAREIRENATTVMLIGEGDEKATP